MMASAYAKYTKKAGLAVISDGSDALLQMNGVYDALFDYAPMVILMMGDGGDTDGNGNGTVTSSSSEDGSRSKRRFRGSGIDAEVFVSAVVK